PHPGQWLFLLEPLADQCQHRHLSRGPLDALPAFRRERQIPHVTSHDQAPSSIRGSRSTSSLPTAFAVSFETRTTSSWLTGSPNAFVTIARPSTRMSSARAGTTSGTMD